MARSTQKILADPEAKTSRKDMYMMGMRNNPYPYMADRLISIVRDGNNETMFRKDAADVLGWFTRAWNRAEIITALQEILKEENLPEVLSEEISKTIARLEVYCR